MGGKSVERNLRSFEEHYKGPIKAILESTSEIERKNPENSDALYYVRKIRNSSIELLRASRMAADYTRLSNGIYPHRRQYMELVRF